MRGAERQRLAGPELEEGGARAAAERGRERSDAHGALASAPAFNEGRQAWWPPPEAVERQRYAGPASAGRRKAEGLQVMSE